MEKVKMKVKIKKLNKMAKLPKYATDEAAGADLYLYRW